MNTNWTSIEDIASSQSRPILPDWLPTNPDRLNGELRADRAGVAAAYNPALIRNAYRGAESSMMGMGMQAANNAALEGTQRAEMDGGGANGAMIKAQAMLPVYAQRSKMRTDEAGAETDLAIKAHQARMQTGQMLANMRMGYLGMLANYYNGAQGQTNAYVSSQQASNRAAVDQSFRAPTRTTSFNYGPDWGAAHLAQALAF